MDPLDWIEKHPVLLDVAKAVALVILAWISGLGRFLAKQRRKCNVWVVEPVSRCYLEELPETSQHKDAVRASFLLSVGVTNPTNEKVVVQGFTMRYETKRAWPPRSSVLDPVPLPARPRVTVGSITKYSRTWFINYGDDIVANLTVPGTIESKEAEDAFIVFVAATFGSWNPKTEHGHVRVWVTVHLTTGENLTTSTRVPVTCDMESFERRVPGIREYVASEETWNVSLSDWRSGLRRLRRSR